MRKTHTLLALSLLASGIGVHAANEFRVSVPRLQVSSQPVQEPTPPEEPLGVIGLLTPAGSSDFGYVEEGTSAVRQFTFVNTSGQELTSVRAMVAGAALSLTGGDCGTVESPRVLPSGASCSVSVRFSPATAFGLSGAALSVLAARGEPASLPLEGSSVDPYQANVVLNLRMEGPPGGSVFSDDTGKAISSNGPVVTSTARAFAGTSSAHFTGGLLELPSAADLSLNSDFAIEFAMFGAQDTSKHLVSSRTLDFVIQYHTNGDLIVWDGANRSAGRLVENAWNTVAVYRKNGQMYIAINGSVRTSWSNAATFNLAGAYIGARNANRDFAFLGFMDNLKVTRGTSRR